MGAVVSGAEHSGVMGAEDPTLLGVDLGEEVDRLLGRARAADGTCGFEACR